MVILPFTVASKKFRHFFVAVANPLYFYSMKKLSFYTALIITILITACATAPWKNHKISTQPDVSCWTGSEAGYELYIWNCLNNEHVVVYQWQAGLYTYPSQIEKTQCGKQTEFEDNMHFKEGKSPTCKHEAKTWNSSGY